MITRGCGYITHTAESEDKELALKEDAAIADQEIRCYRCDKIVAYCRHIPSICIQHGTYERGMRDFSYHFFCDTCRALGVLTEAEQYECPPMEFKK